MEELRGGCQGRVRVWVVHKINGEYPQCTPTLDSKLSHYYTTITE